MTFEIPNETILETITSVSTEGSLSLSALGKIFSRRHIDFFFLYLPENRIWHFIQIVSMSNPVSWKNITNLSSAELAQEVLKSEAKG